MLKAKQICCIMVPYFTHSPLNYFNDVRKVQMVQNRKGKKINLLFSNVVRMHMHREEIHNYKYIIFP